MSLADQKADNPPPFKVGNYILKSVSLADQKEETNPPIQSWNLHFEVSVTCWSKGRDNPLPHPKLQLRFLKSVSLADQKTETTLLSKVGT